MNKNSLIKHNNSYRHKSTNCDEKSILSYGPHEAFCKRLGFIQIRLSLYSTPLDAFKILAHSENAERNELQKIQARGITEKKESIINPFPEQ